MAPRWLPWLQPLWRPLWTLALCPFRCWPDQQPWTGGFHGSRQLPWLQAPGSLLWNLPPNPLQHLPASKDPGRTSDPRFPAYLTITDFYDTRFLAYPSSRHLLWTWVPPKALGSKSMPLNTGFRGHLWIHGSGEAQHPVNYCPPSSDPKYPIPSPRLPKNFTASTSADTIRVPSQNLWRGWLVKGFVC